MKKVTILFVILLLLLPSGCNTAPKNEYRRYTDSFFDTFDTLIQVVGYTKSEEEFASYFGLVQARFQSLHKLYDIYNNYQGINNIKTINDSAGVEPVKVDREIIDLILFAKELHGLGGGRTNIALGPLLKIWHDYRTEGLYDPQNAALPPMEALLEAAKYTDLDKVIVDSENSTVFLADSRMSLDIGAIAKGYAAELAVKEVMAAGLESGIISAGGNVRVIGQPLDGVRERWAIGVHNPDASIIAESESILDTVFLKDAAVVSSGDYQRYYVVDGETMHHLIDPETLMPARYYRAVTVVAADSAVADFFSTELFLLPYTESRALAESISGVEAIWVFPDGQVATTEGMQKMLKSHGATNTN